MVRQLDVGKLSEQLLVEIQRPALERTVRELLTDFAGEHGIQY